jgi:prephenate dehydrogenase
MKTIAIVGFGRFGKTLYRLLKDDFNIILFNRTQEVFKDFKLTDNTLMAENIKGIYQAEVIFYCVSIASFEEVVASHRKYFCKHLLIDVLSVKQYPANVFKKYLKGTETQALLTHPMFGPDSSKYGFSGLPLVMDKFMTDDANYQFWRNYFVKKGLRVVEMSAKEHDKLATNSQGVTHFIGRLLQEFKFEPTFIDTLGAKKLHEVMDQTCNDTWELFLNLQNYNPYTKKMRVRLGEAYDQLYNKLLSKRVNPKYIIYGIQGGLGSFNEEAINFYTNKHNIKNFKIKYLFTTEKVLKNLHEGSIDYGLFAIQNAVGGVVEESTQAMAKYKFKIIDEFAIPIRHFLMKKKNINIKDIKTIMAHPQVFKQCQSSLAKKYPSFNQISGKGDLIDTAKAAWALAQNKLLINTAILGPVNLARIYNLDIVADNLQDDKENYTSFFLVSR